MKLGVRQILACKVWFMFVMLVHLTIWLPKKLIVQLVGWFLFSSQECGKGQRRQRERAWQCTASTSAKCRSSFVHCSLFCFVCLQMDHWWSLSFSLRGTVHWRRHSCAHGAGQSRLTRARTTALLHVIWSHLCTLAIGIMRLFSLFWTFCAKINTLRFCFRFFCGFCDFSPNH